MRHILISLEQIVWHVCRTTCLQFFALFGLILVAGAILTYLAKLTSNTFNQFMFPRFGLYTFGWIGIPVHEFCHAVFCKLFLHDVKKVKWFDPKGQGQAHGFVEHEYRTWNPYHRIGHFFIGLGPVLLGPVILALLGYWLVPTTRALLHPEALTAASIGPRLAAFAQAFVNKPTLSSWTFWLFFYLTIAISSQMEFSRADLKQVFAGVGFVVAAFALVNLIARAGHWNWHGRIVQFGLWTLSTGAAVFVFAIVLSLVNLFVCFLLMTLLNRCCGHNGINPFRT